MTTEVLSDGTDVTPFDGPAEAERRRKLTLLKAVGLDRVSPEQRELALAIAKRYDLDLLLKHLVLIDGKPYVTRDALLWIAHRDGHLDGITVTKPVIEGDYWYAEATVYRTDMSHPFTYGGRYPVKGGNAKFAPEMAIKVAESMALRRAFNISAPTQDERWEADIPAAEPEPPKSLAEKVAEKAAAVTDTTTNTGYEPVAAIARTVDTETGEIIEGEVVTENPKAEATTTAKPTTSGTPRNEPTPSTASASTPTTDGRAQCESVSKLSNERCRREAGHGSLHRTQNEAWTEADAA